MNNKVYHQEIQGETFCFVSVQRRNYEDTKLDYFIPTNSHLRALLPFKS